MQILSSPQAPSTPWRRLGTASRLVLCVGICLHLVWGWGTPLGAVEPPRKAENPPPHPGVPGLRPPRVPPQIMRQALQIRVRAGANPDDSGASEAGAFAADRSASQRLTRAQELLRALRYSEATRLLGSILDSEQDFFFQPDKQSPLHQSLKTEAQRLIGSLPAAGREAYELQFGALARQTLQQAVQAGDIAAIGDVSRQYFHTRAGYTATQLLALDHLQHDRAAAAAWTLEQLLAVSEVASSLEPSLSLTLAVCWLRAEAPDRARAHLERLWPTYRGARVQWQGQTHVLEDNASLAWDWVQQAAGEGDEPAQPPSVDYRWHRGDAARNGVSTAGIPLLSARWKIPISSEPSVVQLLADLRRSYDEMQLTALSGLHPLVVGSRVVLHTAETLLAIDLETGKRLWQEPAGGSLWTDLRSGDSLAVQRESPQLVWGLEQRLWDDMTFGTLTSDGQRVFSIEDLGHGGPLIGEASPWGPARRASPLSGPRTVNRLTAHDLATGKLVWEIGGAKGEFELPLAGNFFLGAPLPMSGQLFALAESAGEIRLLVLDAAKGNLEWSQQLVMVEEAILQARLRRASGASPSFADGVLVCPTVAGAVVAVDPTTRALLWGYRYGTEDEVAAPDAAWMQGRAAFIAGGRLMRANEGAQVDRWLDASAVISAGRVLLAPPDSDQLHCLNLRDGTVAWQIPRGDALFVAAVEGPHALLVGRHAVRAVRLDDGQAAWSETTLPLPERALPSGQGFLSGGRYFLPLNSAEVLAIDIAQGRITGRTRSRTGEIPGNLVPHRGTILSQSADQLVAFPQLQELEAQVARRLDTEPQEPAALALRGEIALERGELEAAARDFRQSYDLRPEAHVQELLVSSVLEGLRQDFARYATLAEGIEPLLTTPEQRTTFLRLWAAGLESSGQRMAAFDTYLRFLKDDLDAAALEQVDAALSVRRGRWWQAQLASFQSGLSPDERARVDQTLHDFLQRALAEQGTPSLERFLEFFNNQPAASEVRTELVRRLTQRAATQADAALQLEALLSRQVQTGDDDDARAATVQWAQLLLARAQPADAAVLFRRLNGPLAHTMCTDNKTGRELVAELPADSPVRPWLEPRSLWPTGKVVKTSSRSPQPTYQRVGIALEGDPGPYFQNVRWEWDQARHGQPIAAVDALGRDLWQVPLIDVRQQTGLDYTPGYNHVRVQDHLLLVSMGRRVFAYDTCGAAPGRPPRLLWNRDSVESLPGMAGNPALQAQPVQSEWGPMRYLATDSYGRPVGAMNPLTLDYVCIPRSRSLEVLDPRTGELLWRRDGIPQGSECFGDDELVFCATPESNDALVFRALDGRQLGVRRLPSAEQRMLVWGRNLLAWDATLAEPVVKVLDVFSGDVRWQRRLERGSKAEVWQQQWLAVVEPSGKFHLLQLGDGQPQLSVPIEPEPELQEIYFLATPTQFLLVTNHPWKSDRVWLRPVPGSLDNKVVNGRAYAFERSTGERAWMHGIDRQAILLRQPAELPLLVFICHVFERPAGPRAHNRNHVDVLCIDKRTGRVLHQAPSQAPLANFALSALTDSATVELRLLHETLKFAYTDRPWEAGPDDPTAAPEETPSAEDDAMEDEDSDAAEEPDESEDEPSDDPLEGRADDAPPADGRDAAPAPADSPPKQAPEQQANGAAPAATTDESTLPSAGAASPPDAAQEDVP